MRQGAQSGGAVVLMDLGSSVLSVKAALTELESAELQHLEVVDAPFVEGVHGLDRPVRERLVLADERPVDVGEQDANHRSAR